MNEFIRLENKMEGDTGSTESIDKNVLSNISIRLKQSQAQVRELRKQVEELKIGKNKNLLEGSNKRVLAQYALELFIYECLWKDACSEYSGLNTAERKRRNNRIGLYVSAVDLEKQFGLKRKAAQKIMKNLTELELIQRIGKKDRISGKYFCVLGYRKRVFKNHWANCPNLRTSFEPFKLSLSRLKNNKKTILQKTSS